MSLWGGDGGGGSLGGGWEGGKHSLLPFLRENKVWYRECESGEFYYMDLDETTKPEGLANSRNRCYSMFFSRFFFKL